MSKFVPRERKHRRLAKQREASQKKSTSQDVNRDVIIPETSSEKADRRQQLRDELRAQQPESSFSSKKRKRLDHYIDIKLKKEENAELIRKLAGQQTDTHLLQSSKALGRVKETKRESLRRALTERAAGVDVDGDIDDILYQRRSDRTDEDHPSTTDLLQSNGNGKSIENSPDAEIIKEGKTLSAHQTKTNDSAFGSGLKRPLEQDESGQPKIKRRKRRIPKSREIVGIPRGVPDATEEYSDYSDLAEESDSSDWSGFESTRGASNGVQNDAKERVHRGILKSTKYNPPSDTEVAEYVEDDESSHETSTQNDSSDKDELQSRDQNGVSGDEESDDQNKDGLDDDDGDSDDEDDSDHSEESDSDTSVSDRPAKSSSFKQWAQVQRNEALGFTPSTIIPQSNAVTAAFKPRQPSPDPVAKSIIAQSHSKNAIPRSAITIARSEEIQQARLALPVVQEEQRIIESIHNNPVVIVCGETGSGKTTQVPQMLFENGYGSHCGSSASSDDKITAQNRGLIGVTQPRRVAAVSVAARVSTELGVAYKSKVAHQVRYDTTVSASTAIKFMTDGILLREIDRDFILSTYAAIVIDEAHERSVNTDILIGTLSRIVSLRNELSKEQPKQYYPLKLIIMSATLRVADFAQNKRLFSGEPPPIVQAEGRQYPVTMHFARKTRRDYVEETANKVARGHRKLPQGTMLIFLTGQDEIKTVTKLLKQKIGNTAGVYAGAEVRETADEAPVETEDFGLSHGRDRRGGNEYTDEDARSDEDDEDDDEFEIDTTDTPTQANGSKALAAYILPLYAALPTAQQMKVFQPAPEGTRLIVLATNVAETSLTIPGVRYVFDCGRSKEKKYDHATGIQTFEIDWISKASAAQRAGRAGRTMAGHCWKLYSSAIYEDFFSEHSVPEILRTPIETTVLQLKAMGIDNVINFPFPTPPERSQLEVAEQLLRNLGALDKNKLITAQGRLLMQYPLSPRFAKILLMGAKNDIVDHAIAVVAALAVGDLFVPETQHFEDTASAEDTHQTYTRGQALLSRWDDRSDVVKMLTAVAAHADASARGPEEVSKLVRQVALREKAMAEVQQLRRQLHAIVGSQHRHSGQTKFEQKLPLATEQQRKMLNQIVAAGFLDQVAIRADLLPATQLGNANKAKRAIEVAYRPLIPLPVDDDDDDAMQDHGNIYVHPGSVLAKLSKHEMLNYIVYSHLSRTASKTIGETRSRTRMHALTSVGAKALAALAQDTPLLQYGKPIGKIEELEAGKKRMCWISVTLQPSQDQRSTSSAEWPLGAWKVEQARKGGEWNTVKILAK